MGKMVSLKVSDNENKGLIQIQNKLEEVRDELAEFMSGCEEKEADSARMDMLTEALDALEDAVDAISEAMEE